MDVIALAVCLLIIINIAGVVLMVIFTFEPARGPVETFKPWKGPFDMFLFFVITVGLKRQSLHRVFVKHTVFYRQVVVVTPM